MKGLKVWHIERDTVSTKDETYVLDITVVARTADDAREIAETCAEDEGPAAWTADRTTTRCIGDAPNGIEFEVLSKSVVGKKLP